MQIEDRSAFGYLLEILLAPFSLITKRNHRIDPGGAARRNETGNCRHQCEQSGHGEINRRIKHVYFEENVFQGSGRDDSEKQSDATHAENKADYELPRALSHHHSEDSLRVSSQRHPNSKLLSSLIH